MSKLGERLLALHSGLDSSKIPHAFGGAIALAFCTGDPRGTVDVDINLFVPPARAGDVFAAMSDHVTVHGRAKQEVQADGQTRVWWDDTAVDLFFVNHRFHQQVAARTHVVPFEGATIPVLDCTDLLVFKVAFDRTKDWADIEAMADVGSIDGSLALSWIGELYGTEHARYRRLAAILEGERGGSGSSGIFGRSDDHS